MATPKRKKKRASARQILIVLVCLLLLVLVGIIAVACAMLPGGDDTPPDTTPTQTDPPTDPPTEPPRNGWIFEDGKSFYYNDDVALTGAQTIDGMLYCFGQDGALLGEGWQEVGEETYYLKSDGTAYYGWLELEDALYYLQEDGTMARGTVVIDEQTWFFTSTGCQLYVVNPWNYVPEGYEVELVDIPAKYGNGQKVDASCYDALMRMLGDCNAAGHSVYILSSYRTQATQEWLYNNQVNKQMNKGYSREEAEVIAATISAIPGTSEHQLGLAVDLLGKEAIAWFREHCWDYGFIIRYTEEKENITGIVDEPWHFRYVGTEVSLDMKDSGLCLEEYLGAPPVTDEGVAAVHGNTWFEEKFTTVNAKTMANYTSIRFPTTAE